MQLPAPLSFRPVQKDRPQQTQPSRAYTREAGFSTKADAGLLSKSPSEKVAAFST